MCHLKPIGLIIIFLFIQTAFGQTQADKYFYIVAENETATDILYRAELKPLYLDNGFGSVAHLQRDNQGFAGNLELLQPGQKIYFLKRRLNDAIEKGLVEIRDGQEIIFTPKSYLLAAEAGGTRIPPPAESSLPEDTVAEPEAAVVAENPTEGQEFDQKTTVVSNDESTDFEAKSFMKFSLGTGYSRLHSSYLSNNSQAVLLSDRLTQLQFSWEQMWSEQWGSALEIEMLSTPYRDSAQRSVAGRKKNTTRFSFGAFKKMNPNFSLKGFVGNNENLISAAYQAQTVSLEVQQLLFLGLEGLHRLSTRKNLSLYVGGGASYYPSVESANYTINSGTDFFIKTMINQQTKKFDLIAEIKYLVRDFSTTLTDQKENLFLVSFGAALPVEDL